MQWQCLKIDGIIYMVGLCGLSFKSFHSVSSTYFFIHCTPQWNGNSNVEEEFMMYIFSAKCTYEYLRNENICTLPGISFIIVYKRKMLFTFLSNSRIYVYVEKNSIIYRYTVVNHWLWKWVFSVDPNVFILITVLVPMYHRVGFRSEGTESKI